MSIITACFLSSVTVVLLEVASVDTCGCGLCDVLRSDNLNTRGHSLCLDHVTKPSKSGMSVLDCVSLRWYGKPTLIINFDTNDRMIISY